MSGLGASFFAAARRCLRFNADRFRSRVGDRRLIAASLAVAAPGFVLVGAHAGFARERRGLRDHRLWHRRGRPLRLRAGRAPVAGPAVGLSSASFFSAFARLPAPLVTGAIAQSLSLPAAFAAFAAALAATAVATAAISAMSRSPRFARKA